MRDQEAPPKKGAFVTLEDDPEDSDEDKKGGRNKGKPVGRRTEKDRKKKLAESIRLKVQIDKFHEVKRSHHQKAYGYKIGHSRKEK